MSILLKRQKVRPEEFFRYYYQYILNEDTIDFWLKSDAADAIYEHIIIGNQNILKTTPDKIIEALISIDFELFSLAWTHYFGGRYAIYQSIFTKKYLYEKQKGYIWRDMNNLNLWMGEYTKEWINKRRLFLWNYWPRTKEYLIIKNYNEAKKMELGTEDNDCIEQVDRRLCSDLAWKFGKLNPGLMGAFWENLGFNINDITGKMIVLLDGAISSLDMYNHAYFSIKNVSIEDLKLASLD